MPQPPRRALLVIDVQNEYVTGRLPIAYPAVHLSLANIGSAMDAASEAGLPVIVIQHVAPIDSPIFAKGSHGWELHDVVQSRPRDQLIEKTLPSAFAGTRLAERLSELQIDTLVVVGYMTHNCVDATVKQALHSGIAVEFLADAAGSLPYLNSAGSASAEQFHRTFSIVMQARFAAVMSTNEWIELLKTNGSAERDTIFQSHQRARHSGL